MTKTEQIYRVIKANPGICSGDIAAKTGFRSSHINTLAQKSPRIRCAGTSRKRRYYVADARPVELALCKLYDKCHARGVRAGRAS